MTHQWRREPRWLRWHRVGCSREPRPWRRPFSGCADLLVRSRAKPRSGVALRMRSPASPAAMLKPPSAASGPEGPRTQRTGVGVARFSTAVVAALILAACGTAPESQPTPAAGATAEAPWNVVLFLADDLAWNQVGYHGSTFYETPAIDAVAAAGMTFSNAYSANPVCSPTRASLMTGKNPARLQITDYIPGSRTRTRASCARRRSPACRSKRSRSPSSSSPGATPPATSASGTSTSTRSTCPAGRWTRPPRASTTS